ncbi:hypothetical protein HZS_4092 [Henneguya salminicola]|uniref:Nucleoporin nup189 (Trinotate prediction) n=1 Tax=Henneguya salminicola TaxID=69463 RepID=A0A6G3MHS7_HENSL|nr:hypothetical protein HZS_4092 [Henneguya salminicola]
MILTMISGVSYSIESTLSLNYSYQLEDLGYWHFSILVLLFNKSENIRTYCIQKILQKHIQSYKNHQDFINSLKIPSNIINIAKANYSSYTNDQESSLDFLLTAHEYSTAYLNAIQYRIPTMFIENKTEELVQFLNTFDSSYISSDLHFKNNGRIYIEFLNYKNQFQKAVSNNISDLSTYSDVFLGILNKISNMDVLNEYQKLARCHIIQDCISFLHKCQMTTLIDYDYIIKKAYINPELLNNLLLQNLTQFI